MNICLCNRVRPVYCQLIPGYMALSLSACANKNALRHKDRAYYDNLESELISEQEAKDRRLRAEYPVSQELQQTDSEQLATTEPNTTAEDSFGDEIEPEITDSQVKITPSITSKPVVAQIVIGQPSQKSAEHS